MSRRDKKVYITASAGASAALSYMDSTRSLAATSPTAKLGWLTDYDILPPFLLSMSALTPLWIITITPFSALAQTSLPVGPIVRSLSAG
jgi:hypothetical protein